MELNSYNNIKQAHGFKRHILYIYILSFWTSKMMTENLEPGNFPSYLPLVKNGFAEVINFKVKEKWELEKDECLK